jgi:hypothetical protein
VPEVLVMREDGCVMSQPPVHDVEASTSHVALPASDVVVSHPEQGLRHPYVRLPTSTRPKLSKHYGGNFETTASRSTTP